MCIDRGYGRGGERHIEDKSAGIGIGAMDIPTALRCAQIVELMQYDGTMNGELFEAWFTKFLCPSLERGKVLIYSFNFL